MTWENHGSGKDKWNIDHIQPCASFNLANPEEQKRCFHYSNQQPLWQRDNLLKSDKLSDGGRARNLQKFNQYNLLT